MPKKKRTIRANREKRKGLTEELSVTVLHRIFPYLDRATLLRCARVSKLWRRAAYSPHLWSDYLFCVKDIGLDKETAWSLSERNISAVCLKINSLSINLSAAAGTSKHKTSVTSSLENSAAIVNARTLVLFGDRRDYHYTGLRKQIFPIPQISSGFKNLDRLFLFDIDLYEQGFRSVIQAFRFSLTQIWLSSCVIDTLNIILYELQSLRDLEIRVLYSSCYPSIERSLCADDIYPNLQRLALAGDRDLIQDLCAKFPFLEHLEFVHGGNPIQLPVLTHLTSARLAYGTYGINATIPQQLLSSHLIALEICSWTDSALQICIQQCPKLEILRIRKTREITETSIIKILSTLANLRVLSIDVPCITVKNHMTKNELSGLPDPYQTSITSLLIKSYRHPPEFAVLDISKIRTLKYSNTRSTIEKRVRRTCSTDYDWVEVAMGSEDWKEATGYKYFHPEASYCLESQRRSHSLWRELDRTCGYHWDHVSFC